MNTKNRLTVEDTVVHLMQGFKESGSKDVFICNEDSLESDPFWQDVLNKINDSLEVKTRLVVQRLPGPPDLGPWDEPEFSENYFLVKK